MEENRTDVVQENMDNTELRPEENQVIPEFVKPKSKKEEKKGGFLYDIYALLHDLVYILAAITLIFVFLVRLVCVDGGSMLPTLQDGDYLALQSNVIMGDLKYGDIIVARKMAFRNGEPIVKRVIATEGQTVRIFYDEKGDIRVSVDGTILDEPYINEAMQGNSYPVPKDYVVDKGCIFVMGDNRNHSSDSRYGFDDPENGIGLIKLDQVLGKVLMIVLPGVDSDTNRRDFSRIGSVS